MNFRPIHSKKRWHDVSPITKITNIQLCVDKSVAYKIGLSMFVVKWLIGWARSHDLYWFYWMQFLNLYTDM